MDVLRDPAFISMSFLLLSCDIFFKKKNITLVNQYTVTTIGSVISLVSAANFFFVIEIFYHAIFFSIDLFSFKNSLFGSRQMAMQKILLLIPFIKMPFQLFSNEKYIFLLFWVLYLTITAVVCKYLFPQGTCLLVCMASLVFCYHHDLEGDFFRVFEDLDNMSLSWSGFNVPFHTKIQLYALKILCITAEEAHGTFHKISTSLTCLPAIYSTFCGQSKQKKRIMFFFQIYGLDWHGI